MSIAREKAAEALASRERCSDPECSVCVKRMAEALRDLLEGGPTLDELAIEADNFARTTFPARSAESISEHLRREAVELAENPTDEEEMADVFILLGNLVHFTGAKLNAAVVAKLAKNRTRKWGKPDAQGVVEHVRDEEQRPAPVAPQPEDVAVSEADPLRPVCLECSFASGGHDAHEWGVYPCNAAALAPAPVVDSMADAATEAARIDLIHVIEWLETGHTMACFPLFEGNGHKAREKGQRLRTLLPALSSTPRPEKGERP